MDVIITNITKSFGKQKVLDNVSFSVTEGELLGFLGPNGAGKSTLMRIITGILPTDQGEVWMGGKLNSLHNIELRRDLGYLPESNPLYPDLYVEEYLSIAAGFYSLKNSRERIDEMVGLTGLVKERNKKIGALSKGYRQRVGLAQALIHDPSVLILDEPTTGLDPNQLEEVRGLIKSISKSKTVIISSHIMQEVEAICNRVVIINKGRIVADGNISDIKNGNLCCNQTVLAGFDRQIESDKLMSIPGINNVIKKGDVFEIESDGSCDIRPVVYNFAVENNFILLTLIEKQKNLEQIFQQLTSSVE
jgi:ABC-2 type transport system ATP-binding protein